MSDTQDIVQAIHDLTRVMIALDGGCSTRSEAIRKLDGLGIPQTRIASILAVKANDVSSVLAKDRKRKKKGESNDG